MGQHIEIFLVTASRQRSFFVNVVRVGICQHVSVVSNVCGVEVTRGREGISS